MAILLGDNFLNIKTGSIVFNKSAYDGPTISEEFFHAFQHDNKEMLLLNIEFEAKVFSIASGLEYGGLADIKGSGEFQNPNGKDYNPASIHLSTAFSSHFIQEYKVAANRYSYSCSKKSFPAGFIISRKVYTISPITSDYRSNLKLDIFFSFLRFQFQR